MFPASPTSYEVATEIWLNMQAIFLAGLMVDGQA
jgi:hypothetical protein